MMHVVSVMVVVVPMVHMSAVMVVMVTLCEKNNYDEFNLFDDFEEKPLILVKKLMIVDYI